MRIVEILLPKGASDRSLSPQALRRIDMLQSRMNGYVDKIMDPKTSPQGREFLKSRLRDDYYDLRDAIPKTHAVAEEMPIPQEKYEVFDIRSKERVSGPYEDKRRARRAADKKDLQYGAIRYGVRPFGATSSNVYEAVTKLPLSDDDFKLVKELMLRPIPAAVAPIYIAEIIEDDELNDTLLELEDSNPGMDVRPIVAEWFNRVMPDQMYRFNDSKPDRDQKEGRYSPVHGYDPKMYKGTNDPITGDAYGSY